MMLNYFNAFVLYPLAERRLKRNIREKIDRIRRTEALPREQREAERRKLICRVLEVAEAKVPYYRDLFKQTGFQPSSVLHDLRALERLPYLTKDIIREQGSRMLNEDLQPHQLHVRKTGGSTGLSTLIYYDQEALDWTAAVNLYSQSLTGRRNVDTEVHLSTKLYESFPLRDRIIERVKCMAMNRVNMYTHAFSDEALALLWRDLRRTRPYLVQGHPSTLYALAQFVERSKKKDTRAVRVFESTGESLDAKKVATIEKGLGCKVFNRYGTAEFGVTAHSRDNPNELEIIDSIIFHETAPHDSGLLEIVGTTTTNLAMPLIRYRSGDLGRVKPVGDRDCLADLHGRVHDLITIAGKTYPTHYLQDILDRVGGVVEFQVLEKKDGTQVLQIVLNQTEMKEAVTNRMRDLFGDRLAVNFISFDELVRVGWRDKFRYVVRES